MLTFFNQWWRRPLRKRDRISAIAIGAVGGFWVGVLGRLMVGSMPVPISTLGYWAAGSFVTGAILGVMFPRAVNIVLYPFSLFTIGGN